MTSGVRIVRWEPADTAALRGCLAILNASQDIDNPAGWRMTEQTLRGWLGLGFSGDPAETWFVPGAGPGSVVAWYRLELPDLANRDRGDLLITIDPAARRRGLGRDLLRHAAERAAAAGRSVLRGQVRDGSAGDAFAAALGAKPGMAGTLRRLDLRAVPSEKIARLRSEAAAVAVGYTLVRWEGPTPPEYLESLAGVLNAYADAPHDAGYEAQVWNGDLVRDRADAVLAVMGLHVYRIAAVHAASGALAAMTELAVDPRDPQCAYQGLTAVTRQHRGHRLGLLVKTAMLEWLAEVQPTVERIETGNATSNAHMIAVNEVMGFEVDSPDFHAVELAVAGQS